MSRKKPWCPDALIPGCPAFTATGRSASGVAPVALLPGIESGITVQDQRLDLFPPPAGHGAVFAAAPLGACSWAYLARSVTALCDNTKPPEFATAGHPLRIPPSPQPFGWGIPPHKLPRAEMFHVGQVLGEQQRYQRCFEFRQFGPAGRNLRRTLHESRRKQTARHVAMQRSRRQTGHNQTDAPGSSWNP